MIMSQIVQYNDWLEEECDNLAREGLRTLVVAKKSLTEEMYAEFQTRLHKAKVAMQDRQERVNEVLMSLEKDLELVCLTGALSVLFMQSLHTDPCIPNGESAD